MILIQRLTSDALQESTFVLPDGTSFSFQLQFIPMQYCWVFTNITYGTFILNSLKVSISPNMLFQFQNQIPFGIACFATDNIEPQQQQDFLSGAAQLYVLTQAECKEYNTYIKSGVLVDV